MLTDKLVRDAIDVWRAGVGAVDSAALVRSAVRIESDRLRIGPHEVALDRVRRTVVVGAGKAAAGMCRGLLDAIGPEWAQRTRLTGWVNVPDDCVTELPPVQIFGARPPGENLPTLRVVDGTRRILELIRGCTAEDLCICLISGGGSALLDLPRAPVTLADQIALINHLSAHRANIQQLNTVRKQLSEVKGGRLAAVSQAPLFCLILSDVLGDPIDIIASGPTAPDATTPAEALSILHSTDPDESQIAPSVYSLLRSEHRPPVTADDLKHVHNLVVGNLGTAVDAAAKRAAQLGYRVEASVPVELEGAVESVAQQIVQRVQQMEDQPGSCARVEGGEPVVQLVDANARGKGGRNQQLVLAVADILLEKKSTLRKKFCVLSGGTDGEDGPTDAAGAWLDSASMAAAARQGLVPDQYLAHNDAYHFFAQLGTLLRTGPTQTNVCDLRVILSD